MDATSTARQPGLPAGLRRLFATPVARALASPHSIDRYLEVFNPLWSVDEVRARVLAVRRETADAVTLTLQPNSLWQGHRAGQYVRLAVEVDGVRRSRCYSISSSPLDASGTLQLTVKRQPGGLVSNWVNDHARAGLVVGLSQAEGDFVLPAAMPSRCLFITGGSGITPAMAMIRTLVARGYQGQVQLLHFVRRYEDVIFAAELAQLAETHDNIAVTLSLTADKPYDGDLAGHFDGRLLAQLEPAWADAEAWVCGPEGLIAAVGQHWADAGLAHRLHIERFTAAAGAVATGAAGGELRFVRSERIAANDGRNLLVQAESAGLRPESGCRMGICMSCKCTKKSGVVRDAVTGVTSDAGEEDIRLCVSVPVGDVTLDL